MVELGRFTSPDSEQASERGRVKDRDRATEGGREGGRDGRTDGRTDGGTEERTEGRREEHRDARHGAWSCATRRTCWCGPTIRAVSALFSSFQSISISFQLFCCFCLNSHNEKYLNSSTRA
jgi:hypothetical protein